MNGYINLNVTFYLNRIDKNNWESSIVIYSQRDTSSFNFKKIKIISLIVQQKK